MATYKVKAAFELEGTPQSRYATSMQLNAPQKDAVMHTAGPLLVFAGAGSGKTRVITYRVANLLANHHVPPYRIIAVTFTNKAAGEMKERLTELAGENIVRDLWVGTFHSICCRLLRRYHEEVGLERSFVIYDDVDQKAVISRVIKGMKLDEKAYPPKQVLSRIHRQKQVGHAPSQVKLNHNFNETMRDVYQAYEHALRTANAVDFDDLILHMVRIAESSDSQAGKELRERFDYLLVDEFQDTNQIQYRLIRALGARTHNVCVVGDDDQSIYSWRGADVQIIRGFHRDFPDAQTVKLEQNYRSTGNIVAAALAVIAPAENRIPKQLFTDAEPGEPILVQAVSDERAESEHVVRGVVEDISSGALPNEIAVFYRINAQSRVLEEGFRSAGIPYQIIGGMKFFDRAEVKDALSYLRLVENPRSDADLMRIINSPTRGIGAKTQTRLLEYAMAQGCSAFDAIQPAVQDNIFPTGTKKKLLAFKSLMDGLREQATTLRPSQLAGAILNDTSYRKLLKNADTAEADARLENLEEFIGSIKEYEQEVAQTEDEPASVAGYLERVSLVADIDAASDKNEPHVLLMTVHASKGLEFKSVYLTGMEEEMFPYRGLDGSSNEELEEERRLGYVAITRAREKLSISCAGMRTIFGRTQYRQPSRFLQDLPEEIVVQRGELSAFGGADPYVQASSADAAWQRGTGGAPWQRTTQSANSSGYRRPKGWQDFEPAAQSWDVQVPPPARKPELADGESTIDYEAFDDMPEEDILSVRVRKGSAVRHPRFGTGVVQSVDTTGDPKVVVRFKGFGERKLLARVLQFS